MKPSPGPISDWVKAPNGDVFFADELNNRILVMRTDGEWQVVPGEFRYPRSIAVLNSMAYVVDSWNQRVHAFHLPEWTPAFEFGPFFCPSGILAVGDVLVVADTNNRRLSFHDPSGKPVCTYDVDGFPKRMTLNNEGTLVVHYDDGHAETLHY